MKALLKGILFTVVVIITLVVGGLWGLSRLDAQAADETPEATPAVTVIDVSDADEGTVVVPDDPTSDTPIVVIAPDVTADDGNITPRDLLFSAILIAVILGALYLFRSAIVTAGASVPLPAYLAGVAAVNSAIESAERHAALTKTPVDDALAAELRKGYEDMRREIEALRNQGSTALGK